MTGALKSSYPDPQSSTGLMLWRVTNAWQRSIRAALQPCNITHVQFVLLAVLASMGRSTSTTQRELADHAATDPMMTSQVLRVLENKGLVERLAHPTDRRARTIAITETGIELVNLANSAVERSDRDFFNVLGEDAQRFTQSLVSLDTRTPQEQHHYTAEDTP